MWPAPQIRSGRVPNKETQATADVLLLLVLRANSRSRRLRLSTNWFAVEEDVQCRRITGITQRVTGRTKCRSSRNQGLVPDLGTPGGEVRRQAGLHRKMNRETPCRCLEAVCGNRVSHTCYRWEIMNFSSAAVDAFLRQHCSIRCCVRALYLHVLAWHACRPASPGGFCTPASCRRI